MKVIPAHLGLSIDSPLVRPNAPNFRPPSWPPPRDFPIVIDAQGNVVSMYGDSIWDITPWAGFALKINFGDGNEKRVNQRITPENANLLRQIVAWWLFGPKGIQNARTLSFWFSNFRKIFIFCSNEGIVASDLVRFPAVADKLPTLIAPSTGDVILMELHRLYEQREQLGFTLLDREGLTRFEAALPDSDGRQTAYIPPRIWTYQMKRLREFLDDFHNHQEQIEACYRFCLDAYAENCGSLTEACMNGCNPTRLPFGSHEHDNGAKFYGPFELTARRFGIEKFLERWCLESGKSLKSLGIRPFTSALTMVGWVGMAYLLNFSLMRIEEAWSLRADCLEVEHDERFGEIYVLRGVTTKTVRDDDARWPTSPAVKIAVDVMARVARLRMMCAVARSDVSLGPEDIRNPYLIVRAYEPWVGSDHKVATESVRKRPRSYGMVIKQFSKLFDESELRIKKTDLQIAKLVNPTLENQTYAEGKIWPLAWHQLRRTGAVNMQASGLVSDATLQYLLKHATRAMSLYYGQGYSRVALNNKARILYIRTIYEVLGKEIARLFSERFISPHGDKRKAEILKLVDPNDSKKLTALAKSGKISWRETLLGGCTKRGSCTYGGIDNVVHCGGGHGGPPCPDVLYDREKAGVIRSLSRVISLRLLEAPVGSPYRDSLEAQQIAVENALNVIESK